VFIVFQYHNMHCV